MHAFINPVIYSLSVFWGYRLLKRSTVSVNRYIKVIVALLGLAFVEGPWIVEYLKMPARFLLVGAIPAMLIEVSLNSPSGKPLIKSMTFDDMVLWAFILVVGIVCAIGFFSQ